MKIVSSGIWMRTYIGEKIKQINLIPLYPADKTKVLSQHHYDIESGKENFTCVLWNSAYLCCSKVVKFAEIMQVVYGFLAPREMVLFANP